MNLLIAVPTYNEAQNIESFIKAVFENVPSWAEILVIDDNSPDGTAEIVEKLIPDSQNRLHILNRLEKQGLGKAYLAAFDWGLSRGYDVFLEMDADFSHNPAYIPGMLKEIASHDVVIGSRNVKGGGVEGWSALRNLVSKGGSLYSRVVLGCPVKDLTGGFNMWTKKALEKIGLDRIISRGYSFQVEMKYRAYSAGCSIREIPIIFPDRKQGVSKMSKGIFFEAFLNVWKIKKAVGFDSGLGQFIKFAITGALGTFTNLLVFFIFADQFNLPEIPVSIGCFLIAATQNYVINHKWSFRSGTTKNALSLKKGVLFILVSLLGLGINIAVMETMLLHFALPYKFIAQACGIAAGMVVNFAMSKAVVFKSEETAIKICKRGVV
jgi:dolichol-phosphate mannosyltransferase